MQRLIDADKLKQHYSWWQNEQKNIFDTIIDLQPTVDPVQHGHWINEWEVGSTTCSKCDDNFLWEDYNGPGSWNYCPNCGAKMDEVENE